ncbi:MAG: hypothetical protein H0X24_20675, partial [Ktedonobacterales bacterium]|nr:hypothetical protein [Ktedonobacterales bacterium]
DVHGVKAELQILDAGGFQVLVAGRVLRHVTYTRDEAQHGRRSCDCGLYNVGKAETMVAHVIGSHSAFSQRPAMSTGSGMGDFRLSGKHADPTYDQAIRDMIGHAW